MLGRNVIYVRCINCSYNNVANGIRFLDKKAFFVYTGKRGYYMVWEIDTEVCPRLEFDNIMFLYCLGYDFLFMVHLSFYAIPLLIYDVMYDITRIP